jgi:hypothetical protein
MHQHPALRKFGEQHITFPTEPFLATKNLKHETTDVEKNKHLWWKHLNHRFYSGVALFIFIW